MKRIYFYVAKIIGIILIILFFGLLETPYSAMALVMLLLGIILIVFSIVLKKKIVKEGQPIENKRSFWLLASLVTYASFIFMMTSIFPFIGNGTLAYFFGVNKYRSERYGFLSKHVLLAMLIGELILFLVSALFISAIVEFNQPIEFWAIVTIVMVINYLFSVMLYYFGEIKAKK